MDICLFKSPEQRRVTMHCNVTRGDEITFLCSVENVPGVVTPDSYLGAEQLQTHEIKTMEGRLVSNFTLDTADLDLEEAVFLSAQSLSTVHSIKPG